MDDRQPSGVQISLLYHFCRLRLPAVLMALGAFEGHLQRAYNLARPKRLEAGQDAGWPAFLDNLHVIDWFLASACLDGQGRAWEALFAARASRTDSLLVDALRGRAVRLFPRDEARQEQAVADFWGYLLAGEREGSTPILARYDGLRPLVPWLIRVFQNKHLSDLPPSHHHLQPLPDEPLPNPGKPEESPATRRRWYEEFERRPASGWRSLDDKPAADPGFTAALSYESARGGRGSWASTRAIFPARPASCASSCLQRIGQRLQELGWTGEDLSGFILKEMDSLLLDEGRLSADRLAALLAARGKTPPATLKEPAQH